MSIKARLAMILIALTTVHTASADARQWCEVNHGQSYYADSIVRVTNYGLYDGSNDNCQKPSAPKAEPVAAKAVAPEVTQPVVSQSEVKMNDMLNRKAINLDVQFDSGSAQIQNKYASDLAMLTEALKNDPSLKIEVAGHTDVSGNPEHNEALSKSRAGAIKAALVKEGVEASRITTVGLGAKVPKADNKSATGRAQNRRIEVKIQ